MVSYYHTKVWVLVDRGTRATWCHIKNYGWGRQGYYVNLVSQDTKVGVDRGYYVTWYQNIPLLHVRVNKGKRVNLVYKNAGLG